jgi:negative regulator of flagellin synthesis FlgM
MKMKINGPNYSQFINQLYKKNSNNKFEKRENVKTNKDTIEISKTSKDVRKYIEKMKDIETGNQEKIERIKEALDSGTYKVSSKDLAKVIVNKMNQQRGKGEE